MSEDRRKGQRRQMTRSGRRASDPQPSQPLQAILWSSEQRLLEVERALSIMRLDLSVQRRRTADLHVEVDKLKVAADRLMNTVQALTAAQKRREPS